YPLEGCVREWYTHDDAFYYDALSPHARQLDIWATEYIHLVNSAEAIVEWYQGTGMRPFLEALPTDADRARFTVDYLDAIRSVYLPRPPPPAPPPPPPVGRLLFPSPRLSFTPRRYLPAPPKSRNSKPPAAANWDVPAKSPQRDCDPRRPHATRQKSAYALRRS